MVFANINLQGQVMFNLRQFASAPKHSTNLESYDGMDAATAFTEGYDAAMGDAFVSGALDGINELNQDMELLADTMKVATTNLESGDDNPELELAVIKTTAYMAGKYGFDAQASTANLESATGAISNFLKTASNSVQKVIAQIIAIAKKTWLSFSAWLASADGEVKNLEKKLKKFKDDKKKLTIKGEDRARAYLTKLGKMVVLHSPVGTDDKLANIVNHNAVTDLADGLSSLNDGEVARKLVSDILSGKSDPEDVTDGKKLSGIEVSKDKLKTVEFTNDKTDYFFKDENTKVLLMGIEEKKITLLGYNDSFVPEDSEDDPVYMAKVITVDRESDVEGVVDATLEKEDFKNVADEAVVVVENNDGYDSLIGILKSLPKGSKLQSLIKTKFKGLEKSVKEVEKDFKNPQDWADKAAAAKAKKEAYIAASKGAYAEVTTVIQMYKATLSLVSATASLAVQKNKDDDNGGETKGHPAGNGN